MKIHYLIPQRVNIHTSDLKSSEQLVLWSLRTWVMGIIRKIDIKEALIRPMETYARPKAALKLNHFFNRLPSGQKKGLIFPFRFRGVLAPIDLTF